MANVDPSKKRDDAPPSGAGARGVIVIAFLAAALAFFAHRAYHWPYTLQVAAGLAALGVLVLIPTLVSGRSGRRRQRTLESMNAVIPGFTSNGAAIVTARNYGKNGFPRHLELRVGGDLPIHDQAFRRELASTVRSRMGQVTLHSSWNVKRGTVKFVGKPLSAQDLAQREASERTAQVIKPLFRRTPVTVTVTTFTTREGSSQLYPGEIELSYGATTLDGSEVFHKKLETVASLKFGGRWRAQFFPRDDRAILMPRPPMPSPISHPGASIYEKLPSDRSFMLYYGQDENGETVGWKIGAKTTMPHALIVGPTGGGKTTVLRSLLLGSVAQGIRAYGCDPKMVELTPFAGFPGVSISSTPEDMAQMIETMHGLMMDRYAKIKADPRARNNMTPILFILDEFLILRQVLNALWTAPYEDENGKTKKRTGKHPALELITAMLALARTAMIHMVIGVQRPDASLFDDGARDNMRQRISLMRLSPQGAQMLWGSPYEGTDLPMVPGRAMASPGGDVPVETQTFWIDDPINAEGEDREIVESLRALAEKRLAEIPEPVDVSGFTDAPIVLPDLPRPVKLAKDPEDQPSPQEPSEDDELPTTAIHDVVAVDELMDGDSIELEGRSLTVVAVEQDEMEADSIVLTVADESGAEEDIALSESERVTRVTDLLGLDDAA